jgi:hypothetical protein
MPVVELEPAPALAPGPGTMVVVKDMGKAGITCPTLDPC